jgi:hypothetical protein
MTLTLVQSPDTLGSQSLPDAVYRVGVERSPKTAGDRVLDGILVVDPRECCIRWPDKGEALSATSEYAVQIY